MNDIPKSIYLNNDYSKVVTVGGWIGTYGSELATIDRLTIMGYRYSNHAHLGKRAEWLESRIAQLENIRHPDWPCSG